MKLSYKLAAVAVLLASLSAGAMAQDSKIGYINTQRITTESVIAKAAQAKLEQEFSKRGKELADLQAGLKTFSEKFERDAPTLTESQRASRQKEGAELNRDFQRKQREFREDLNLRQNEENAAIIEKANKAIKQLAETEKYDLIVQDVVWVSPKLDVTDKIIKALSEGK